MPAPNTNSTNPAPCPGCGAQHRQEAIDAALKTCPGCGYHYRMEPRDRIQYLTDPDSFTEFSANLSSLNPSDLSGYEEKLSEA
jgi:acetyl-CoA carboxylase carboxyl transferase subunit beta